MNVFSLPKNLQKFRRGRGITQEELADFIGVTKASVSKWENGQSLPDILLLPQLAAYFDVSVDDLLGYQPQLSTEQIRKYYHDLAADFAELPFEQVMDKCLVLVKKYYSCYSFLLQISVLWLNHFSLAQSPERQSEVLEQAAELCLRILSGSRDIGLCNDAVSIKAVIDLQQGRPQDVIDSMEQLLDPRRFTSQSDAVLIQAYKAAGDISKADSYAQICLYNHLLSLVADATQLLLLHPEDLNLCEETIRRISQVNQAFSFDQLNPNTTAAFYFYAAVVYAGHRQPEKVFQYLWKYAGLTRSLLDSDILLHGDSYFNCLDSWFLESDLGAEAVRNKKLVRGSAIQALDHPSFAPLSETKEFRQIRNFLEKEGGHNGF